MKIEAAFRNKSINGSAAFSCLLVYSRAATCMYKEACIMNGFNGLDLDFFDIKDSIRDPSYFNVRRSYRSNPLYYRGGQVLGEF